MAEGGATVLADVPTTDPYSSEPQPPRVSTPFLSAGQVTQGLEMLQSLTTPDQIRSVIEQGANVRERLESLAEEEEKKTAAGVDQFTRTQEAARSAGAAYREAAAAPRPTPPTQSPLPAAPDVTVRPWLDPHGKDALTAIAQMAGALALGLHGLKVKAPQTTLRLFKEAAEAWRTDEKDRAESAWRQFQLEVERVKDQNARALTAFDLADRQHGQALDAKRATVISLLEESGMAEHALAVARVPYEQLRQHLTDSYNLSKGILDASLAYDSFRFTQQKGWLEMLDRMRRAEQEAERLAMERERLGIEARKEETEEPRRRAQTEEAEARAAKERAETLEIPGKRARQEEVDRQRRERAGREGELFPLRKAIMTQAATMSTRIDVLNKHLVGLNATADDILRLDDAFAVLQSAGVLPSTPSVLSGWAASAARLNPGAWQRPEVQQAWGVIQSALGPTIVGFDRNVRGDMGARIKAAYGHVIDEVVLPQKEWIGIRDAMVPKLRQARDLYGQEQRALQSSLQGLSGFVGGPGVTGPPAPAESE